MEPEATLKGMERQCRRYRWLFGLAALLLAALLGYGAATPTPEVIRARRFELVDAQGRVLLRLRGWPAGGLIEVKNVFGETTTWIGQTADGHGVMTISSGEGRGVIGAGADPDGNGFISILDHEGKGRALRPAP